MFKSALMLAASLLVPCVLLSAAPVLAEGDVEKAITFGDHRDLNCSVLFWLMDNGMMVAPRLTEGEESAALSRAYRFLSDHQATSKELKRFLELESHFAQARRENRKNVFALTFTRNDLLEVLRTAEMIYLSHSQSPPVEPGFINELSRGFKAFRFVAVSALLMVVGLREICEGDPGLGICVAGTGLGAATYFINSQRADPMTLFSYKLAIRDRIADHNGLYLSSEFIPRNFLYNFFLSSENFRNFRRNRQIPVNQRVRIDWFAEVTPQGAQVTLFVDADESER